MARKHKGSVRHNSVVAAYKFTPPPRSTTPPAVIAPSHLISAHADIKGITFRSLGRGGVIRSQTQAW